MERECRVCGHSFKKPINCSLKEWHTRRKTCSKACADIQRRSQKGWNKGHTKATHPSVAIAAMKIRRDFQTGRRLPWSKGLTGKKHPLFGCTLTPEHRERIGLANRGDKHWNWKGGLTEQVHRLRNQSVYQHWRQQVLQRDGSKCRKCGVASNLHCHHIRSFRYHPKLRYDVGNGMTLCASCHQKEHRH